MADLACIHRIDSNLSTGFSLWRSIGTSPIDYGGLYVLRIDASDDKQPINVGASSRSNTVIFDYQRDIFFL